MHIHLIMQLKSHFAFCWCLCVSISFILFILFHKRTAGWKNIKMPLPAPLQHFLCIYLLERFCKKFCLECLWHSKFSWSLVYNFKNVRLHLDVWCTGFGFSLALVFGFEEKMYIRHFHLYYFFKCVLIQCSN